MIPTRSNSEQNAINAHPLTVRLCFSPEIITKINTAYMSPIKEEDIARRPISEVANFKSAANRKTMGEAVLARITVMTNAKVKRDPRDPVSSYTKKEMAAANIVHIKQPPLAMMLAGRKFRIR